MLRLSEWTLTLMTSHKKKGANENFELVYRETWETDLVEISGMDWDQKEKLDVTLERPDVTLYGLIELPVCHFVCLLVWLFLLGCVCTRMFAVAFAFILEDCVLPVSVCHPTPPAKMRFLKIVDLCFNQPTPSPPQTPPHSLPFPSVLPVNSGQPLPKSCHL